VANSQLTLKQFAILMLGQSTPPGHLGDLLKSHDHYRIFQPSLRCKSLAETRRRSRNASNI
jgi:hypothetical protein